MRLLRCGITSFTFLALFCLNIPSVHATSSLALLKVISDHHIFHYQEYSPDTAEQPWSILVYRDETDVILSVHESDTKNELISYSNDYGFSDRFISLQLVNLKDVPNPVILSIWQRGVHGQRLVIFDPALGKNGVVFDRTSAWPISFDLIGGRINITIAQDREGHEAPAELKFSWPVE